MEVLAGKMMVEMMVRRYTGGRVWGSERRVCLWENEKENKLRGPLSWPARQDSEGDNVMCGGEQFG